MRKVTANIIKCLLLLAVTVYLTFAFVLATLNPFEWGEGSRLFAVMVFYGVSALVYLVNKVTLYGVPEGREIKEIEETTDEIEEPGKPYLSVWHPLYTGIDRYKAYSPEMGLYMREMKEESIEILYIEEMNIIFEDWEECLDIRTENKE